MKISTCAALFAAVDVISSLVVWALSPSDSVRVWYPTPLSYVGEHLVAATTTVLLVWLVLFFTSRPVRVADGLGYSLTLLPALRFGFACVMVDVLAGVELAFLQSRDGGVIRLWHTQKLSDYLFVRESVYVALEVVLLTLAMVWIFYSKRQKDTPDLPSNSAHRIIRH